MDEGERIRSGASGGEWEDGMRVRLSLLWEKPYMSNPYGKLTGSAYAHESTEANSLQFILFPFVESRPAKHFKFEG